MPGKKIKCWEFMNCGVDKPGCGFKCPSYPDMGRVCWSVAGTMCGGEAQGVYAKKIDSCTNCRFYIAVIVRKEV